MSTPQAFSAYPTVIRASSGEDAPRYLVLVHRFAVHGRPLDGAPFDVERHLQGDGGEIAICRGDADQYKSIVAPGGDAPRISPVYAIDSKGEPAVPTGLLFVRFAQGVRAAEREAAIAGAGYELVEVPPYAPQAAWVRATGGDIAAALTNTERLEGLKDVINVEPQMLRAVSRR